jgi:hypothetical protein
MGLENALRLLVCSAAKSSVGCGLRRFARASPHKDAKVRRSAGLLFPAQNQLAHKPLGRFVSMRRTIARRPGTGKPLPDFGNNVAE